jgi:hypothetical protein
MSDQAIQVLAQATMNGVARMLGTKLVGKEAAACRIMRQEVLGFLGQGDRAAAYADTRAAVISFSISEQWAMLDLVTKSANRILTEV